MGGVDDAQDYDPYFATDQLAHWQIQAKVRVSAMRVIPPASRSVMVATQ
jgi:hypothetical protein